MKTIGIVAHSAEGGGLCFLTACHEGEIKLGEHMHPEIVLSAIPMALSLPGWLNDDHDTVAEYLTRGVHAVHKAGADFYVCPDNTAHIVLEKIASTLPICGLHIADVVCHEIQENGWTRIGLLGTDWTMTGPVYANRAKELGHELMTPPEDVRKRIDQAIFDELCQGKFLESTIGEFVAAIDELKNRGAQCVILGCTEIPLIINSENSPLPVLDSTRLLARYAVNEAISGRKIERQKGWLEPCE